MRCKFVTGPVFHTQVIVPLAAVKYAASNHQYRESKGEETVSEDLLKSGTSFAEGIMKILIGMNDGIVTKFLI